MGRLADVQQFVDDVKGLTSFSALEASLLGASEALGFRYFALMHHVEDPLAFNAAHVSNYPPSWIEMVAERKYWTDDPVAAACQRSLAGFAWTDLPNLLPLSSRQLEILAGAREAGLGAGFTVPANIPGEISGSVSFGTKLGKDLPVKSLANAQYLGCFAYEAARRLGERACIKSWRLPSLLPSHERAICWISVWRWRLFGALARICAFRARRKCRPAQPQSKRLSCVHPRNRGF